ncbi:MAG: FG-GAP repeat protein [Dehalococcoidia bacterium]|nr:FG-GAP repeat protein [Dehalococcoidia bacterium]
MAIDGDTIVASVHADFDKGTNAGAAVVFTRSDGTWTQQSKLIGNDTGPGGLLGQSVAISGDSIIIRAPSDTPNGTDSGSAYVFTRIGETWTEQAKLTGSSLSVNSMFGWSVAIEDDTAAVGVLNDEANGDRTGAAYAFIRTGGVWVQQAWLTSSDAASEHTFGRSVALSGHTLTVGAPGHAANGANTGAAYVFIAEIQ